MKSFYQNNSFSGNGGAAKVRVLQSYEVLWIRVIDVICIFMKFYRQPEIRIVYTFMGAKIAVQPHVPIQPDFAQLA